MLIANECTVSRVKLGIARLVCKFDTDKSYDQVNAEFLILCFEKNGFWERKDHMDSSA